jgi:hypothetical protein
MLAMPSWTSAAEVIGQNGTPGDCGTDVTYVSAETGPPPYTPAAYGVITSWSGMSDDNPVQTHTLRLLVMKPDPGAGPNNFIAVQKDSVRTLTQVGALNTFSSGVRLPIEAGERLGLYVPGEPNQDGMCDIPSAAATGNQLRSFEGEAPFGISVDFAGVRGDSPLNASAVVEPDADHDGFGDETQDQCPTNASTQGACPVTPVTSAKKKKCKKHKKKHSASSAKKKKCKKKKK